MKNAENKNIPKAYRIREFCNATSLGKTKVFAMLKNGTIASVKVGGRRLIPATEVDRLLEVRA